MNAAESMLNVSSGIFNNKHDITTLSSWGPYSKRYAGISHIPDLEKGIRFDFSVMPGFYRNRLLVPSVLFESSYHPWSVTPSMDKITYRYEMEWKDKVYVDVTYYLVDSSKTLVAIQCVNNTDISQNLVLNNMAYINYPEVYPEVKALNADSLKWYNAIDYETIEPVLKTPQYHLVYDGLMRNEERSSLSIDGSLLARGFGKEKGDRVVYRLFISKKEKNGLLSFRFRMPQGKALTFESRGLINHPITFTGTGKFEMYQIPYQVEKEGSYILELISGGGNSIDLDGFYVGLPKAFDKLTFSHNVTSFIPVLEKGEKNLDFILKYQDIDKYYGVAWNFEESEVREIWNSELESFFKCKVQDHVSKTLVGDKQWHYTNAFLRPVILEPQSEKILYTLVCVGKKEEVSHEIEKFHLSQDQLVKQVKLSNQQNEENLLPGSESYMFGRQLLQAAILTNVVYPVYTQKEFIRHFTPGKYWNCLYTWDLGFISIGLIDIDPVKAFECIKAYTTPVGNQSAFIHHGTPLPIQIYAFFDLWSSTHSRDMLQFLYPRLKQYYDFMAGKDPTSTTRMKGSGLLRSWDYFYNSGGWDDYPPQQALGKNKPQYRFYTPVVTTAYYIRAAKILRQAAKEIGLKEDIKAYDKDIKLFSDALQDNAWDNDAGYYSYVKHDSVGNAVDIFRYADGSNYNKGLDGVTPLLAGICTPEQTNVLVSHLFSEKELWTKVGISTVDQSASYYKSDGYWNGAVWIPHQWLMWKALLDAGRGDQAFKIAETALKTWEKECEESYSTFEHFIISSGRGAGWHQFSGLSSPILNWFSAYYKIGKVSTGYEIWIKDDEFEQNYTHYRAQVVFDDVTPPRARCMIICMNPRYTYKAFFNGKLVSVRSYHKGLVELTLPPTKKSGEIIVQPQIINNPNSK